MHTITFTDITPPSRDTGVAWSAVNIFFSTSEEGPFAIFDQIALTPLDSDPANPIARTFTTSKAPADGGWFRLEFIDMASNKEALAPIFMQAVPVSQIATLVRSYMPTSYEALANLPTYGQETIDLRIESARYEVLPASLAAQDESTYSHLLKDLIACKAALQMIPAAIEHWMRQKIAQSASNSENLTYTDPIPALRELQKSLLARVAQLEANANIIAEAQQPTDGPEVDTTGDLVTSDPYEWPSAFATGTSTTADV